MLIINSSNGIKTLSMQASLKSTASKEVLYYQFKEQNNYSYLLRAVNNFVG